MAVIAVDARPLSAPLTGIGRYTKELLDRLIPGSAHTWYLYSDRPLLVMPRGADPPRVRHGNCRGRISSTVFAQVLFARWARQDGIDLFWSPRHHLPLCLDRNIATLLTVCDLVWRRCPESMRPSGRLLERVLMPPSVKRADHVIAISHATAADLDDVLGCPSGKVSVIYPAASSIGVPPNRAAQTSSDEPYLLFVGTHEPRKNLRRLLVAYATVAKGRRDTPRLVLAGMPGWGNQEVTAWIEELSLQHQVTSLGYVSDEELELLYNGAFLLLAPSLYEGFCLPVVEAISRGVPVLTSNIASMPEAAGKAGVLVDPTSIEAIASALQASLQEDVRMQLRNECPAQAALFSWEHAAHETGHLIERLLADRAGLATSG